MEKAMAKALCQQFHQCRLMENATDLQSRAFREKGIWQLTPKGIVILQDFCVRTEADMSTLRKTFGHLDLIQLVRLERLADDDQIAINRSNMAIVFRVMMTSLPLEGDLQSLNTNVKSSSGSFSSSSSVSSSSSAAAQGYAQGQRAMSSASSQSSGSSLPFSMSSQSDSRIQLMANNLLSQSKRNKPSQRAGKQQREMRSSFSAQLCTEWLADYTTVSSKEEAEQVATEFVKYQWLEFQDPRKTLPVKASSTTTLNLTAKGKDVVREPLAKNAGEQQTSLREILSQDPNECIAAANTPGTPAVDPATATTTTTKPAEKQLQRVSSASTLDSSHQTSDFQQQQQQDPKDSNAVKLKTILDDPQLRSLFKDFLRVNYCEENLDFWIDYDCLRRKVRQMNPAMPSQNQRDLLEDAYDIWTTYLAPGARCELNVEHTLRQEMNRVFGSTIQVEQTYMPGHSKPKITLSTNSPAQSLRVMMKWFERVNEHICRLMASDSVPKFVKTTKYRQIVEEHEKISVKDEMPISVPIVKNKA
ncbi:regulator of G protein signaling domain-containing protein [Dichotomocladium elegans]|nr:regulator of G protein signaling domain-containing protein [Dichotomocladium elegans]